MKKFSFVSLCILVVVLITSCEKSNIENEEFQFQAIDKDKVESPGGQSLQKVDKDEIESPGGQSGGN